MKLEFLADGSPDCPLIRLYAFDRSEVLRLKELISALAAGTTAKIPLQKQPGIHPVDGCELVLSLGKRDRGVEQVGSSQFECVLTDEGWTDVTFLLEPFCEEELPTGHQWLNEKGKIALLISASGSW